MGVCTRYFLSCSKCDYVHFLQSSTGLRSAPTEWVYSSGSSESFPLLKRLGWCQDCNSIQSHEHIPNGAEIDAFVEEIKGDLAKFVSGEWDWYGAPRADHARSVIKSRSAWHDWSRTRNRGRCLTCGSTHVTPIDPSTLWEGKGELPFAHPGCGGALRFGTDEDGIHFHARERDPDEPITCISYSYAGFPTGDRLDEVKRKLEEKHPGATVDLRAAVARVVSGQVKTGKELTFRSLPNAPAQAHLGDAVFDFICRELEDSPPDPRAQSSLSRRFPEIHELAAVLIRETVHKLPSTQRSTPMAAATPPKAGIGLTTALHRSPFHLLSVSMRDDRRRIVAHAEEQALHLDAETCQKARADLTNPRTRLSAELAWLPGLSPRRASALVETLKSQPWDIRQEDGLPALAKANLLAAASEVVDADFSSDEVSDFIHDFALLVDDIDPEDVLRSINEDRAVSGFPEVRDIDLIEAELAERKRYYRNAIKAA